MEEKIIELLNKRDISLTTIALNDLLKLNTIEEYQELEKTLREMVSDGILYYSEKKKKYLLMGNSHLLAGRLILNEKGYGFVKIDKEQKDIYINVKNINNAINNDTVLIEIINNDVTKPEGKIIRILKRDYNNLVGEVYIKDNNYYVNPDKKGTHDIFIPKDKTKGAVTGHKVLVTPLKEGNYVGEIVEIIGHKNDVGIDILSFVYEYGFKPKFPKEVMDEMDLISDELNQETITSELERGRRDLRNEIIVTIDGDDTKDIDDAISIKTIDDNHFELGVHIADVSYYVTEGSEVDNEAYSRGTSVYLVDQVCPMLPHKLSNGICSLNPGVDRLALSCVMKINKKGNIVSSDIFESIIKSRIQMTYNKVNEIIEENKTPEDYEEYIDLINQMNELSKILRKKMISRGYIEFNSAEAKIIVDDKGYPTGIEKRVQRSGESLIENFMIAANEAVATSTYYRSLPGLYRIHDKPNQEKIQQFLGLLSLKGYVINGKNKVLKAVDLQNILAQLQDKKEATILNKLAIRTQAKAVYSSENIGHFGLGSQCYCHFTAPIRRYPDLIFHRLVKLYNNNYNDNIISELDEALPEQARFLSTREQDADNCERDVEKMKKAEYMEAFVGEIFEGVISGVTDYGLFIELDNTVEGLIRVEDLDDDYYIYNEKAYALIGRKKGKTYGFGDQITVKVKAASKLASTVDFEIVREEIKNEEKENKKKTKGR